jgi:N-acetylglucosaminyl-diphospho-decaprenol L-rhamnosyltransferase
LRGRYHLEIVSSVEVNSLISTTTDMQRIPELSIIVVNWNSLAYVRECLRSIDSTVANLSYEVVVVDNGSSVDEASTLRSEFPSVKCLRSEENLGFARANNWAVDHAKGEYLLFLNPDTKVLGSAILTMFRELRAAPNASAIGCKLLNSDGSVQTSCIQRFPTIFNQVLDIEALRRRFPRWELWGTAALFDLQSSAVDVEVISGACIMVSRWAFEKAGRFNTRYFMYAEDVDLCYQLRKLGRRVVYTGNAQVIHHGGGASQWQKGRAWVAVMQRQAILSFCRHTRGWLYAAAYRCAMAMNAAIRLLLFALMRPFRRLVIEKQLVHSTPAKWLEVLKWTLGLSRIVPGNA